MATTAEQICNMALSRIGQREFLNSLNDSTVPARICKVHYEAARDSLLAQFPWKFATRRAQLALLDGVTRSGWSYAFGLPADFISPQYLFNGARPGQPISTSALYTYLAPPPWFNTLQFAASAPELPFDVEAKDDGTGSILVTDQTTADLAYTARIATVLAFPPLFVDALAWRLGAELALGLAQKPQLAQWAEGKAKEVLGAAEVASLESQQEDFSPASRFVTGR